jgi:hypothetical protein
LANDDAVASRPEAASLASTAPINASAVADLLKLPTEERPDGLLPADATVDSATFEDGVVEVNLTGAFSMFTITDGLAEEVAESFAHALDPAGQAHSVRIRARNSADEPYRLLDTYVRAMPPGVYVDPQDRAEIGTPEAAGTDPASTSTRGVSMGIPGHQPAGALTGVTVFATGGHGWTGSTSGWGLQRGLVLEMIEDYGNLDQLNYFVQYAYNAGATVVPFRPVGYQNNEIVVDNDDPEATYTGAWTDSSNTPYYQNHRINGVGYRVAATSAVESATARFTPAIPATGMYPVYTWALDGSNRTTQTYRITYAGGTSEVVVDHRVVGKGWVWLGNYYFEAGTSGYVTITNQSGVAGNVIADAIRFGNGIGDVTSVAAGSTSGYPRDEECQRYWAESETSKNAVGYPSAVYDCCTLEQDDNVGAAARWAREMNNTTVDAARFHRIYIEFHTNAAGGRGTLALITTSGSTTFQAQYAQILGEEVENDLVALSSGLEFAWSARNPNTLSGSYGAINTGNNSNEFDATILEIAFHDNSSDAALLLDPKVRDAVARSSVQGIVKFLNSLAGSTVPLSFAPDRPRRAQVVADGAGNVVVSWQAPLSGPAYGDAATGYRIYRSPNGYGFDSGVDVGNVLTTTLADIPADTTTYVRIAAYNAGGESMPSETLTVRRAADETSTFLIVNGFDRVGRSQNPRHVVPAGTQRRPLIEKVNSFNYTIQQGDALAAAGATFDSCSHQAIVDGTVSLANYAAVNWISGEESSADDTFDATEQTLLTTYLSNGGRLFVSGAEIAWDLDSLGNGVAFYRNQLHAAYVGDDAATYSVGANGGSIFAGVPLFTFDNGAQFYDAEFPDRLAVSNGSTAALTYSGGTGDTAAVVYDGPHKVVNFGFPFEIITNSTRRAQIMDRIVGFFFNGPFDADRDGDVDLHDLESFTNCLLGPGVTYGPGDACLVHDIDADTDVDLADFLQFVAYFTGP